MKILLAITWFFNINYRRFDACMTQAEYHLDRAYELLGRSQLDPEDKELSDYYKKASLQEIKKAEDFRRHADYYM